MSGTLDPATDPATSASSLGHLEFVDPRTVWSHEAHDFTPWLAANYDDLAAALGIDIEITGTEHPVGRFSLDILGTDVTHDKPLIIENQLAEADHGHLGQLLTYAAGTGASTIVWIATVIREEYRQALTWLNEQTDTDTHFFGVELRVAHIGSSSRAPMFDVVVKPNDWQKSVKAATAAKGTGKKAALYAEFWSAYLERVQAHQPAWSRARGTTSNSWFSMSMGLPPGLNVTASFAAKGRLRHEIFIGRATEEECKQAFDALHEQKQQLEDAYGGEVSWERLDNRKGSRIADYRTGSVEDTDQHAEYIDWFVTTGIRLRKALDAVDAP